MLVPNAFAPYSRGLRIGRALATAGYRVEIAAIAERELPEREVNGDLVIRRYRPRPRRSFALRDGTAGADSGRTVRGSMGPARRLADRWIAGIAWPGARFRGWWAALDEELGSADLYHCCGLMTLEPALRAARRRDGRGGKVIYDVIDDWFRSESAMTMPAPIRAARILAEDRRARQADAIITINEVNARRYERRWRPVGGVVSVPNYPQIPDREELRGDLIRREVGLDGASPIVLYQGLLNAMGPVAVAERAVMSIPGAAFVTIGFGSVYERLRERDGDPKVHGRHFTLPARHPDELIAWTASADVVLMRMRTTSLNDRLTTPNKLWEALAGGTPVVVPRRQWVMARLVEQHDLGAVAEDTTPSAVAAAIRSILERPAAERAAMRERIATLARERWDWPIAEAAYRRRVSQLDDR